MALPSTGAVSVDAIRTEFGLTGSVSFSDLYRAGTIIRDNYGENAKVPTAGELEFKKFRGLYREGTIAQKIGAWESYRDDGLHTQQYNGEVKVTHSGDTYGNGVMAGPGSPQTVTNTQSRTGQIATSEWTTIIGVSASGSMSNRTNPITSSHTQYGAYTDTHNGNANMATVQINLPFNDIGNLSYQFNRFNTWRWGAGMIVMMPGKWEVNRDYNSASTSTGWGINSIGIGNSAPSLSLAANEIAVYGRERGGDGASSGWIGGTNVTHISINGWWYNTGNIGISWNTGGGGSASPAMYNEQPDGTWILREVS